MSFLFDLLLLEHRCIWLGFLFLSIESISSSRKWFYWHLYGWWLFYLLTAFATSIIYPFFCQHIRIDSLSFRWLFSGYQYVYISFIICLFREVLWYRMWEPPRLPLHHDRGREPTGPCLSGAGAHGLSPNRWHTFRPPNGARYSSSSSWGLCHRPLQLHLRVRGYSMTCVLGPCRRARWRPLTRCF
jgi:hypothetical protein